MNRSIDDAGNEKSLLEKAGFAADEVSEWFTAFPELRDDLKSDSAMCVKFWDLAQRLRAKLPSRPQRASNHAAASDLIRRKERHLRERFLGLHVEELYNKLTADKSKFLRIEELMPEAAKLVPGLTPGAEALLAERALPLSRHHSPRRRERRRYRRLSEGRLATGRLEQVPYDFAPGAAAILYQSPRLGDR